MNRHKGLDQQINIWYNLYTLSLYILYQCLLNQKKNEIDCKVTGNAKNTKARSDS